MKNPVSYNELKTLLVKNTSLKVNQEKWYRDMSQGLIKIKTSSINWTVKLKSVVCILILKLCLLYLNILSIYKYIVCTNIIILVLYTRCCMWIYNIQIIKYKRGKIISRVRMMVCGSIDSSSNLEFYPLVN